MADVIVIYGKLNHWAVYAEDTPELPIQYVYYNDGTANWRKGVRDGVYVIDKALNPIGFSGMEDLDWENVYSIS